MRCGGRLPIIRRDRRVGRSGHSPRTGQAGNTGERCLGITSESTSRRTLQRLDADGLDVILGAWAALHHDVDPEQMQVVALTASPFAAPEARRPGTAPAGRFDPRHHNRAGTARRRRQDQRDPMLSKLLDTIDILGVLITADALHTQTAHADTP